MYYLSRFRDLALFFRGYVGNQIFAVLFIISCAGVSESLGLIMVLPLFSEVSDQYIPALIIDFLPNRDSEYYVLYILVFISIFFVLKGSLVFWAYSFLGRVKEVLYRSVKSELINNYSFADYKSIGFIKPSDIINNIGEQSNKLVIAADAFVGFFSHLILSLIYIFVAFYLTFYFGLLALCGGVLIAMLFKYLSKRVVRVSTEIVSSTEKFNAQLIESVLAQKYLRSTGLLDRINKRQIDKVESLAGLEKSKAYMMALMHASREPIAVIMVLVIIAVQVFVLEGAIEPILISIIMFHRATSAALMSQSAWHGLMEAFGSIASVDALNTLLKQYTLKAVKPLSLNDRPDLVFSNVSFSYSDKQLSPTVSNISFDLPFGNVLALVGSSGAGKTTIIDLICGLYTPDEGVIKAGGDILDMSLTSSWKKSIGYVSQEPVVFDGSITENITMCFDDSVSNSADVAMVQDVLMKVGLLDFVLSLPDGIDTNLSSLKSGLSGGQKQRISIARELFRSPNLLILDEATSALDSESEQIIQDSIDLIKGEISIVVIAHRLSTVRNADKIIVLDKGAIVETGSYLSLVEDTNSTFYRFASMQGLV